MFESVSDITFGIAAVMQLTLSIDYSIMLLHRFQQEYELTNKKHKGKAMERAITNSLSSISGSALTTVVGLDLCSGVNFPESMFSGCSSLKEITIPDSVESIGHGAFSGCTSLKSISFPARFSRDYIRKLGLPSDCKIKRRPK